MRELLINNPVLTAPMAGITDRAYMLFEGKVLFQGTSEELASNPVVREKYLGQDFVFTRKKYD